MTYRDGQFFELNGHRWTRDGSGRDGNGAWHRRRWVGYLIDHDVEGLDVQVQDPPAVPFFVTRQVMRMNENGIGFRVVVMPDNTPLGKTVTVIEGEPLMGFVSRCSRIVYAVNDGYRLEAGDRVLVFRRKE